MPDSVIRQLCESDIPVLRNFCEAHWGSRHPLIFNEEMFAYYYRRGESVNFVGAFDDEKEELQSVCGFLFASGAKRPDVWISFILTKKGAPLNLGFKILEHITKITECRSIACNNIRKKTGGLYEFLGWHVGSINHWYRLNETVDKYTLCNIVNKKIRPVEKRSLKTELIATAKGLEGFDFSKYTENKPYKDRDYVEKRFFCNPWITYRVYSVSDACGRRALVVLRAFEAESRSVLRVVDLIGDREIAGEFGEFIEGLMRAENAEFCDFYEFGLDAGLLEASGFVRLCEDDENIIPDYLSPPLLENSRFYMFTSDTDGYFMTRADGDQDRPNLG